MKRQFKPRTRSGFLLILAIALLVAFAQTGLAQESSAITGKITDPSGAAVANATVTANDVDRGTVWPTKTNAEGIYSLPTLPIGRYSVRVEAGGFESAVRPPFNLELNQTARIDITMTIGAVSATVEVSSSAPLLQTETTQVGTVMESHSIANLPLETGNYNQLALLVPGAVTTSPASFNAGQATFNSGRPQINGNREQANYYLLDGVDNNEFVDNNVAYSPSVEAISELSIVTSSPSAEYGQFMGGVISANLKSGTNQMHGSAFWSFRRDALNANEWYRNFSSDPAINGAPPKQKWDLFGGTIGGPIKRDKLFFFADYQGTRFDTPATTNPITTFTTPERTGNFTDLGVALHYPGTTVAMPADLTQATICGPGQKMGSSPCITGISPTGLKILSVLPQATGSGLVNNATNVQQTYTHGDQGDFKVDYRPTQSDNVFVRYSQQHVENPFVNSQPLLYNSSGNNVFPLWNGAIGYTHTFGPTVVNELRLGVNYFPAEGNTQGTGATNPGAGLIPGQPTAFLPGLYFTGAPVAGGQNGPFPFGTTDSAEIFHQTTIQISDTVSMTHGAHSIAAGFQALRYRNDYVPATSSDGAAGQIGFTGQYTGNAEVDFLLGLPQYMAYGQGFSGTVGQRNSSYGAFVQDNWRVNSKLTLNVGVRWQLYTPIYEVHDRMTNFGEYSGAIELAGQNGNSRALYNQYNGIANFLPRIGVAWTPWGNSTVIRAAFSRTSFQEGTGEYNRLATNAPWNIDLSSQFVAGTNGAIPANQVTLDQGFGALGSTGGVPCNVTTVLSAPASCFAGIRIHMTDPNYRPSISNNWNFTIQHQFGNATTVSAGYVGQHADHLADIIFAGQKVLNADGTTSPSPYLSGNPTLVGDGLGQVRLNATTGIQNYNALQLSAQQRLSKGLAFGLNYSWQKCLTNAQGYYGRYGDISASQATADVAFQLYAYNINLDYGLCDRNVTNAFNGYTNYDLPFGHNRALQTSNKVVDAILGDWQINGIFSFHGGFPISMLDWAGDGGTGSAQGRPDCIAPSIQTPYKNYGGGGYIWFDPSTMANPAPGHLGNCGVGTELGPGLKTVDLGLTRQFNITERQKVEFRFQAINAFNTPILTVTGYSIDVHGGANEGVVNTSTGARNLQFGLKYTF